MAAGRDLRLVARYGRRDGRDPRVHLLLEDGEKERGRGLAHVDPSRAAGNMEQFITDCTSFTTFYIFTAVFY